MLFYTLREANQNRQYEWTGGLPSDMLYSSNELAGEAGEICEVIFNGAPKQGGDILGWFDHLGEELADGIICIDLLGMATDLGPLPLMVPDKPGVLGAMELAAAIGAVSGGICNTVKKLERERRGWPGSRATKTQLETSLISLGGIIGQVAALYRVDLATAVAVKFNRTSEKVGLATRLAIPEAPTK